MFYFLGDLLAFYQFFCWLLLGFTSVHFLCNVIKDIRYGLQEILLFAQVQWKYASWL